MIGKMSFSTLLKNNSKAGNIWGFHVTFDLNVDKYEGLY